MAAGQAKASDVAAYDKLGLIWRMAARLPPLESFRVLDACVRHANFTRAAAELGVTPAAVSLRMRDLEADLGVPLFVRHGPRVAATSQAVAIAAAAAQGLAAIAGAVAAARPGSAPIRLTAPPTFAAQWLAPRLAAWHARPGAAPIRLDAATDLRPAEAFDVAIRAGLGPWPGFEGRALLPMEAAPMLSPELAQGRRLTKASDLLTLPLLPHPDWPRWLGEAGAASGAPRFYGSELATSDLDASVALAGAAVALLPPNLFGRYVAEGRLLQPFGPMLRGPEAYHLLTRADERRASVLSFRDWLATQAAT